MTNSCSEGIVETQFENRQGLSPAQRWLGRKLSWQENQDSRIDADSQKRVRLRATKGTLNDALEQVHMRVRVFLSCETSKLRL